MLMQKKYFILFTLLISTQTLSARNEIGPEGSKIAWIFVALLVFVAIWLFFGKKGNKKQPLIVRQRVKIEIEKDRLYFPDELKLTVKNTGNIDIDLDRPLLIFDNFWLKRKFRLKGMDNHTFYPLFMVKNYTHTLNIDLNHFYSYDKKLKRYPKVKIILFNVKGKRLGSNSVYLRKTLVKF